MAFPQGTGLDKLIVSADALIGTRITVEELAQREAARKAEEKAKKVKPKEDDTKPEES